MYKLTTFILTPIYLCGLILNIRIPTGKCIDRVCLLDWLNNEIIFKTKTNITF